MNTARPQTRSWFTFLAVVCAGAAVAADGTPKRAATPGAKPAASPLPAAAETRKLDLRIPDVTELYTPAQIQAMLSHVPGDQYEDIEVRGERIPVTPDVWTGLAAPVWGLLNPTQVWRIIAPIPPDRIHAADVRPEAQPLERDPFRP
jgi:hypothetical protein